MSTDVKQKEYFLKKISNEIRNLCKPERIHCLLAYGSFLSKSENEHNDIDLLLLLDSYSDEDYQILKTLKKKFPQLELFIDYKDQIESKGVHNYQRGRHGVYFFKILSFGKVLIGENYYKQNIHKISEKYIQRDLLFRIEEYFYRIQKNFVNNITNDTEYYEKYVSRILIDIMLFDATLPFEKIHEIHHNEIINLYIKTHSPIDTDFKNKLMKYHESKSVTIIPTLLSYMYNIYLTHFDDYRKKYE